MDEFRTFLRSRVQRRGDLARLSEASGVASAVIGRWLTEGMQPTPANLKRMVPALGLAYTELLRMCDYLPGDGEATDAEPADPDLSAYVERVKRLLAPYPRAFRLSVLQANERMVEAVASLGESVARSPEGRAISTPARPANRGQKTPKPDLKAYYPSLARNLARVQVLA